MIHRIHYVPLFALAALTVACGEAEPSGPADAGHATRDVGGSDGGRSDGGLAPAPTCIDAPRHLANELWGPLLVTCRGCHNDFGLAVETGTWELQWDADPNSLATNVAVLKAFGQMQVSESDTRSLLLSMASDSIPGRTHPGGRLIEPGGATYIALERLINEPFETCEGTPAGALFDSVVPLEPWKLLYKAQQVLTGHTPSLQALEAFEGAGSDLGSALDTLMEGEDFLGWVKATYKDLLLTDGPLGVNGNSIVYTAHLRGEEFPNRFYFYNADNGHPAAFSCCRLDSPRGCAPGVRGCCGVDDGSSAAYCAAGDKRIATDLSHEPLELIAHIVGNHLPLTEILTADYTMVNPFTAEVYDAKLYDESLRFTDRMNGDDWKPTRLFSQQNQGASYPAPNRIPHAGVVSSHAFMNRFRTTRTNLNRARARSVYKRFMGIDIGGLLEFTVTADDELPHNPTLDARTCRTCHAAMDPLAGAFRHWDHVGRVHHGAFWDICGVTDGHRNHDDKLCVRRTGYKGELLDETDSSQVNDALNWMMQHIASDRRFALRSVQTLLEGLTGIAGIKPPQDRQAANYDAHLLAYLRQQEDLANWAQQLIANGHRIRPLIKTIIQSPWFNAGQLSAAHPETMTALEFAQIGGHKNLTPERLHTRLIDVTGFPWRVESSVTGKDWLLRGTTFKILYGGIDGESVLTRAREPYPVMAAVARRMGNEMSCLAVAQDFAINDRSSRRLFPHLDHTMEPENDDGPLDEPVFRLNLQYLHYHILGERLAADSPQIDASYALLRSVWRRGVAAAASPLHERCRAVRDYYTGDRLAGGHTIIGNDQRFVLRSWMAVVTYLLSDAEFLLE